MWGCRASLGSRAPPCATRSPDADAAAPNRRAARSDAGRVVRGAAIDARTEARRDSEPMHLAAMLPGGARDTVTFSLP